MSKPPFFIDLPENKTDLMNFAFWALLVCGLFFWFQAQYPLNITADTLWMAEAAHRILQGEKFTEAYYDPNPPLSMMLYIPAVLAAGTGLISLHTALFFYTLLHLALAALVTRRILHAVPGLDRTTINAVSVAFIIAGSIAAGWSFTERDQIIGFWLVPFILLQLALTKGWPVPRWVLHLTLLAGTFMVLVKPHHGLIPTLMILHRAYQQKRLTVFKDADFIYLAMGVISYAALLWFYFPDFVQSALPDILSFYPADNHHIVLFRTGYYGLFIFLILMIALMTKRVSWLTVFLLGMGLLSLIPFLAQWRGYHYQLLPALMFLWCGGALLLKEWLARYMSAALLMPLICAVGLGVAFYTTNARAHILHADAYPQLPLARALQDCPEPCRFMVVNNHIEITHQTALYTGKAWASRFASPWFIPSVLALKDKDPARYQQSVHKYAGMYAADLAHYKPHIIMFAEFDLTAATRFDLLALFAGEKEFQDALGAYEFQRDLYISQGDYFPHLKSFRNREILYKVYTRKEP